MGKPTFKQVLDALKRQVLVGKSYLGFAKGLLNTDPVLQDGARTIDRPKNAAGWTFAVGGKNSNATCRFFGPEFPKYYKDQPNKM